MQDNITKFKSIKYLGVDWGEKRIGLAIGDNEVKVATPYKVISDLEGILRAIKEEKINFVVVGRPLKMQSIKYKMQNEFLEFLGLLKKRINIPVKTIDERLSSRAADALVGSKKIRYPRDAIAAMLILQSYLDKNIE